MTTICARCNTGERWLGGVWCLDCIRAVCCDRKRMCLHRQRHPEAFR